MKKSHVALCCFLLLTRGSLKVQKKIIITSGTFPGVRVLLSKIGIIPFPNGNMLVQKKDASMESVLPRTIYKITFATLCSLGLVNDNIGSSKVLQNPIIRPIRLKKNPRPENYLIIIYGTDYCLCWNKFNRCIDIG